MIRCMRTFRVICCIKWLKLIGSVVINNYPLYCLTVLFAKFPRKCKNAFNWLCIFADKVEVEVRAWVGRR